MMRLALTLIIVTSGALLLRYAMLGRNPWDDVLAVIRGEPLPNQTVSGSATAVANMATTPASAPTSRGAAMGAHTPV